jgi:hypothetical protein
MNFSKLQATRRVLFTFLGAYKGDNQIATISDVNEVYNRLNNLLPYRLHDVEITQSSTDAPTFRVLAQGAVECTRNCTASGGTGSCGCDCPSSCTNETAGIFSVSATYVSAGVYEVTFALDATKYPRPIKNVGFFFGPLPSVESKVAVAKVSANVYRIYTADKSNAATNGLLTETVLAMKIYF